MEILREDTEMDNNTSAPVLTREAVYQLALGYAFGVWHASPQGTYLGVSSDEDAVMFATAYADHHHRLTADRQVPVWEAFGEWRCNGGIVPF